MRAWGAAVGIAVVALGACGDDSGGGDGGEREDSRQPVVRCTPAPSGARAFTVRPRFKPGDSRTIRIEKQRSREGVELRSTAGARLKVLSGGPRRAVLRWTAERQSLPLPPGVGEATAARLEGIGADVPVEYDTDPNGTYGKIRNAAAVRRQLGEGLDEIGASDAAVAGYVEQLRRVVETDAAVQALISQDFALLHGAYGVVVRAGRPQSHPYELGNPFGGEPLPATAEFRLVSPRDRGGCVAIELVVRPDLETLRERVAEALERLGQEGLPEDVLESFEMETAMRFAWDARSGWIVRAEAERRIEAGEDRQTERTVLTSSAG